MDSNAPLTAKLCQGALAFLCGVPALFVGFYLCGLAEGIGSHLDFMSVLKRGGVFFCITYGQPASRTNYLAKEKYAWTVTYEVVGKTRYMYIMKTGDAAAHGSSIASK